MAERAAPPPAGRRPAAGRRNWALWLGGLIVLLVAFAALEGPRLAPSDPLQENFIVQDQQGEWVKPPFAPLAVPGFLLGTDSHGRDVLSQMLWGVRPTLTLVLVVAALRLTLGLLIGLTSGWSAGRLGRALEVGIRGALIVPPLFVALFVIALLGAEWGVWAFILGLSLTGWGDAARLLREQARQIKRQPYVEASQALGLSDVQLLYRHVLPQVMPVIWTLLAFEVSSTMLVTAGLGFLGYFINSVWIPLGDWTAIRASGQPELGQMLATAAEVQQQPWTMAVAGSMVFITVLGFNLLGEGLRQQLTRPHRPASLGARLVGRLDEWIEGRLFDPLSAWRRTAAIAAGGGALLALIVGGGAALYRSQAVRSAVVELPVPGGHLWAAERHDAYGTVRSEALGPTRPDVRWEYRDVEGFAGGPAVAADGTLYVAGAGGTLFALTPQGAELWRTELPAAPVGAPALNEFGEIYVADSAGGLTAVKPEGVRLWSVPGDRVAALAGPIVGPDGTAYYPTDGSIVAVDLEGQVRWKVQLPFYGYVWPLLTISPSGEYLFFDDVALRASDGYIVTPRTLEPADRYFVGLDGRVYLGGPESLIEWRPDEEGDEGQPRVIWDGRSLALGFRSLHAAGTTPDQRVWILFAGPYEYARMVWLDFDGGLRAYVDYPYRPSWLAGVDAESTVYMCGVVARQGTECRALEPESRVPLWTLPLEGGVVNGGALAPGRLYVTTDRGVLYAIESDPAAR